MEKFESFAAQKEGEEVSQKARILCEEMLSELRSLSSFVCNNVCVGYHKDMCASLSNSIARYDDDLAELRTESQEKRGSK